jgi:hypothetical protein
MFWAPWLSWMSAKVPGIRKMRDIHFKESRQNAGNQEVVRCSTRNRGICTGKSDAFQARLRGRYNK